MLAGMSLGTDVKRFSRGVMPRIAMTVVVLMPLLYGAMYLWAFWDPFNEVGRVPVALVNSDRGATVDGKRLDVGAQVAQGLRDSHQLDLREMPEAEAASQLSSGKVYFTITLPEDFSKNVASPTGDDPEQAKVRFTFNGANNYLGSIIGQNAAREVINKVNAEIGEQSIGAVLTGLTDAGEGLGKAADGADELHDGLVQADDGAHQLSAGLNTASDGTTKLAAGTKQLRTGVDNALNPMIDVLGDLDTLAVNPDDVANAALHLAGAVRSTSDRIAAMNINYAHAAVVVDQVVDFLRNNPDETLKHMGEFLASAQKLMRAKDMDPATDTGLAAWRTNAAKLENDLANPDSKLRQFLTKATNGQLRKDVVKLRDGVEQLDNGAQQLKTGMTQLSAGAAKLADGTSQLRDGSAELATKLRDGSTQVPSWTPEQRTATAKTLAAPATLEIVEHNPMKTFGTGFAPFFMPLALFIGALIVWMLLKPLQTRPIVHGLGALRVALASYWPGLLIVAAQVTVMYLVVHYAVGLDARYPLATVGFLALISAAFLALIQAFNAVFGVAVGRVLTLAFLMFQLVSAGGIYPVETTAKPFQWIHPFDPMTYAVNGLRQLIAGGVDARLWTAIAVLLTILATSLAASSWAARRNRQYTMERLYPPIEV
ncbi:YhgE/Pip domain-containing protein [Mycolicibacterium brumae]|uniref:YhgE/Pip domain-containing protein n=2 Tax=Mycolicibacterium brumae TaxID=85968 RepID=A0A2G5P981_9MYCO|nr:YhgE/Pip domain-containing protein [Mycolicibacterium brumae]